jgi:PPK2 family polyphosphate:nucleotide phosphotransferase
MRHPFMSKYKKLTKPYEAAGGKTFRLKDFDAADTGHFKSKEGADDLLREGVEALSESQGKLYAQDQWAVLLIFQAMDAAGKDSTIKHVMSGLNPQGCDVHSFKAPSTEELDHDYLWRCTRALPSRGRIGIFNRSYYEETLVVRVHPEALKSQKIPAKLFTKHLWKHRFEDIRHFEQYLARNGVVIRKFFLNVSKEEQRKRFLGRLDEKEKNWKFSPADLAERACWDKYMRAYEEMIRHTSTPDCPWYVVPADHKWFTRLVVAAVVNETLDSLNLHFPKVDPTKQKELAEARKALAAQA